jgi:transposase
MRIVDKNEPEVIEVEPRQRRHRSKQERREIAEESLQPGASVAVIARSHGVNANQVFHWRKLLREGRLDVKTVSTQLMPVRIAEVIEDKTRATYRQTGSFRSKSGGSVFASKDRPIPKPSALFWSNSELSARLRKAGAEGRRLSGAGLGACTGGFDSDEQLFPFDVTA